MFLNGAYVCKDTFACNSNVNTSQVLQNEMSEDIRSGHQSVDPNQTFQDLNGLFIQRNDLTFEVTRKPTNKLI
jgi:hypothetical protein